MEWGAWGKQWAGMRDVDEARNALGSQLVLVLPLIRYDVFVLNALFALAQPRSTDRLGVSVWSGLLVLLNYRWMLWDPRKGTVHDELVWTFAAVSRAARRTKQMSLRVVPHLSDAMLDHVL